MAHFVQLSNRDELVHNIFSELANGYTESLKQQIEESKREEASFPEVAQWLVEHRKILADKDFHGLFLHCFNVRSKILNTKATDGTLPSCYARP